METAKHADTWRLVKRVRQSDSRTLKIGNVAGHQSEIVDERDGGDLLVERVGWVENSEVAPDLRSVRIKSENVFAKRFDDARHPRIKKPRLFSVAAAADEFDTAAQLADGIAERNTGWLEAAAVSKNAITPRFALTCFRASLITLVSIKYMRGKFGRFAPLEIRVDTHVRHRRQNLSKGAPARARERRC